MRLFSILGRVALCGGVVLVVGDVQAEVVVAEDFFYDQVTDTESSFSGANKFDVETFGGGQNGVGAWEARWFGIGAGLINGDDVEAPPFSSYPHTASVTGENSAQNYISRPYSLGAVASGSQPLYFSAKMLATDPGSAEPMFSELGVFSTPGVGDASLVSIGLRNGTFFGRINGETVEGDPIGNAWDGANDEAFHHLVGKLELNAGGNSVEADFNQDGVTDAADYTVWRDNRGLSDGSAGFEQGDATGDGNVDDDDYQLWRSTYKGVRDRLTVYMDPTGEESSQASVLVIERSFANGFSEVDPLVIVNGGVAPNTGRRHFVDDVVIGTSWEDVVQVDVPRLTLEVDASSGETRWRNETDTPLELAYYEITSENGSLDPTAWASLDEAGAGGGAWLENHSDAGLLIESNLSGSSALPVGGGLAIGSPFDPSGAADLLARWGSKSGGGLLNLANVVYVNSAGAAVAAPEPSAAWLVLTAFTAVVGCRRRGG